MGDASELVGHVTYSVPEKMEEVPVLSVSQNPVTVVK